MSWNLLQQNVVNGSSTTIAVPRPEMLQALTYLFRSLCSPAIVSVNIPFYTIISNEEG